MSQLEVDLLTSQKLGLLMLKDEVLKDILYYTDDNNKNIFYDNYTLTDESLLFDLQRKNDINLHISLGRGKSKPILQTFTKLKQDNKNNYKRTIKYLFEVDLFIFTDNPEQQITTQIEGIYTRRDYFAYCYTLINDFCRKHGNTTATDMNGIDNNTEYLQTNFHFQMLAEDILTLKDVEYLTFKLNSFNPVKSK